MSRRCRPLIAAAAAAFVLAPVVGVAQTPAAGANGNQVPRVGAGPAPGATMTQSVIPDPNASLLQPSLQGNPNNPPKFRKPGTADNQTPPTNTFVAPSRIGATPKYGSQQGFGAGDTGFDSMNLTKAEKKKLQAQAAAAAATRRRGTGNDFRPAAYNRVRSSARGANTAWNAGA